MRASVRYAHRYSAFMSILGISAAMIFGIVGCGTSGTGGSVTGGITGSGASTSAPAGTVSTGAQLGMLWNSSDKTLRPIVGVPGSSWLGASVVSAGTYESGAYSPVAAIALLTDANGNLAMISAASQQPVVLAQGAPANASIIFSPSGNRAAVFAPGSGSALLISGLPSQPSVTPFTAGGAITAMAVGDDGTLLLATPGNTGVSITEVSVSGSRSTVASLSGFGGMSFLPASDDFLLADSVNNTLVRMHNGAAQTLATHTDGLNQPLAVAASTDGQWAITANHADGTLVRVSLTGTAAPVRSTCSCSPSELLPLAGNAVFELTQPASSPSWLVDAGRSTPGIFFIPPTPSTTRSSK